MTGYTTRPLVCRTLQAARRRRVCFAVCLDMYTNSAEQLSRQQQRQRTQAPSEAAAYKSLNNPVYDTAARLPHAAGRPPPSRAI